MVYAFWHLSWQDFLDMQYLLPFSRGCWLKVALTAFSSQVYSQGVEITRSGDGHGAAAAQGVVQFVQYNIQFIYISFLHYYSPVFWTVNYERFCPLVSFSFSVCLTQEYNFS